MGASGKPDQGQKGHTAPWVLFFLLAMVSTPGDICSWAHHDNYSGLHQTTNDSDWGG